MSSESELYTLLSTWLEQAETLPSEEVNRFRAEFGRLEKLVFGSTEEQVKNPTGCLYDLARNNLVQYSGCRDYPRADLPDELAAAMDPVKFLRKAKETHAQITRPNE